MPRATRNTKTNSGNEVSAPPKPKTWSNTSALTPSAAANDSTTVAISMIGAISARSSSARMRNTTARMTGMITVAVVRGRVLDVQVDRRVAADQRVRAGDRVHGGADPVDGVVRGLAVRGGGERALQVGVARA